MTLRAGMSKWCGPRTAAKMLGVSVHTVEKWLTLGSLKSVRKLPGKNRIILVADLMDFLRRNRMANTADVNLGRYNVGGVDRFRVALTRDGATWSLGPGAVVTFTFKAPDRMTVFTRTAVIENGPGGLCYYDTTPTDILLPGWWELGVKVDDGYGVVKPYPYSIGFNVASQPY